MIQEPKEALVQNATSRKQLKDAKSTEKINRDNEINDLLSVLQTIQGRRVVWRILSKCKTFETIWHASAAIHYNAGQQDIGHWLLNEISASGPEPLMRLMKENYNKGETDV